MDLLIKELETGEFKLTAYTPTGESITSFFERKPFLQYGKNHTITLNKYDMDKVYKLIKATSPKGFKYEVKSNNELR